MICYLMFSVNHICPIIVLGELAYDIVYMERQAMLMNPMLKHAFKVFFEDKKMKKMYSDLEKMSKDVQKVLKQSEQIKEKWK